MFDRKIHRVEVTCENCGQAGSVSWEELEHDGESGPEIGYVSIKGFYQQPALEVAAIFCSNCGAMRTFE